MTKPKKGGTRPVNCNGSYNLVSKLRLRCGDVDEGVHDLEEALVFRLVNVGRRIALGDLVQQKRSHRDGARAVRMGV